MKTKQIILILFVAWSLIYGQNLNVFPLDTPKETSDSIRFIQVKTDTLFNSNQIISIIRMPKVLLKDYLITFGFSKTKLQKTSVIAKDSGAEMAINGGFFNRDSGGSVTYFEMNDNVISASKTSSLKWSVADSLMNGAIVLTKDSDLKIQFRKTENFYRNSDRESAVLVTGPVLLFQSNLTSLPVMSFVTKRHPRTCLCSNESSLILITIDGRQPKAAGMSLKETQQYLKNLGCRDAINLDGGGSTTMWIKNKGVVNFPSDKTGERPVSNVLLIIPPKER